MKTKFIFIAWIIIIIIPSQILAQNQSILLPFPGDTYPVATGSKMVNFTNPGSPVIQTLPKHGFEASFNGYYYNPGDFPITAYLTDKPDELDVKNEVIIDGKSDMKLEVPVDFKNVFGHYLMVFNGQEMDEAHVTIILAKGKSQSGADEKSNIAES